MDDIQLFLRHYSLLLLLFSFVLYIFLERRVTQFTLVLVSIIVMHMLHGFIIQVLEPMFVLGANHNLLNIYWYGSFGITDILMVIACVAITKKYALVTDYVSKVLLGVYSFFAFWQFATLITVVSHNRMFYQVYGEVVMVLNAGVMILALAYALRPLYHLFALRE